jgi:hypothetical protein
MKKMYWCVVSTFYADGGFSARVFTTEQTEKQYCSHKKTSREDCYTDWFDNYEEVKEFLTGLDPLESIKKLQEKN